MKYFKWWENTQQNQINYRLHFRFLVVISWCHLSGDICLVTLLSDICLVTSAGWHLSGVICLMSSAWCHLTSDICLVTSVWCHLSGVICLVSSAWCHLSSVIWRVTSVWCHLTMTSVWCHLTVTSAWCHLTMTSAWCYLTGDIWHVTFWCYLPGALCHLPGDMCMLQMPCYFMLAQPAIILDLQYVAVFITLVNIYIHLHLQYFIMHFTISLIKIDICGPLEGFKVAVFCSLCSYIYSLYYLTTTRCQSSLWLSYR